MRAMHNSLKIMVILLVCASGGLKGYPSIFPMEDETYVRRDFTLEYNPGDSRRELMTKAIIEEYGLSTSDFSISGERTGHVRSRIPGYTFSFNGGLIDSQGKSLPRTAVGSAAGVAAKPLSPGASGAASRASASSTPAAAAPVLAPAYAGARENYSPYTPSPAGARAGGVAPSEAPTRALARPHADALSKSKTKEQIIDIVLKNGFTGEDIMDLVASLLDLTQK